MRLPSASMKGKVWATLSFEASIDFNHHQFHSATKPNRKVLDGVGPVLLSVVQALPRDLGPTADTVLSHPNGFLGHTLVDPLQKGRTIQARRRVPHEEANHAFLKHVTQHLRRRRRPSKTQFTGHPPFGLAPLPRAVPRTRQPTTSASERATDRRRGHRHGAAWRGDGMKPPAQEL